MNQSTSHGLQICRANQTINHPDRPTRHPESIPTVFFHLFRRINFHMKYSIIAELEAHITKIVKISGPFDSFGLKLLNTHNLLKALLQGKPFEREIFVFGMPLELGVLVFGKIDEIRLDQTTGILTLSETKTRNSRREPGTAQWIGHELQIMLYKRLFLDYIHGEIPWKLILLILSLDGATKFSSTLQTEIALAGLTADNLMDLYGQVVSMAAAFPREIVLNVEYIHQRTRETFLVRNVEYDEGWLRGKMVDFVDTWTERKVMVGASEREAWKCHDCSFGPVCQWKQARIRSPSCWNHFPVIIFL